MGAWLQVLHPTQSLSGSILVRVLYMPEEICTNLRAARLFPQEVLVPGASSVHVVTGGNGGELRAGVVAMSRHPYGCRVIQRILEHCTLARVRDSVKAQAQAAALDLARDVYGNYISQHLLIHGTTEDRCGPAGPPRAMRVERGPPARPPARP